MRVGVVMRSMDKIGGSEITTRLLLKVLAEAGHGVTLYTSTPPKDVPAGVSVTVPDRPAPPVVAKPPFLGRFDFYRGGYEGLVTMSDDDVLIVSDWEMFMERTRARRVLFYFHLPPVLEKETIEARLLRMPPRKWPRFWYRKRLVRKRVSWFEQNKVVLVPNSRFTGKIVEDVFGRRTGPVLYPPVRVTSLLERGGEPKRRRAVTIANYWPGKGHNAAMRIAHKAGIGWTSLGTTVDSSCWDLVESLRGKASPGDDIRANPSRDDLVGELAASKVYLHAADESFGMSVVEAIAVGCVPIVPNRTATVETVPFDELRFDTEDEASEKVRAAADGKYDRYLAPLAEHAKKFSEEAFAVRAINMINENADR